MYNKILVPIDITEKSLAHLVMAHIQYLAEYEKAHIHFLAIIPTVPFYTTMGFGFAEKADSEQENVTKQLAEIIKEFNIPNDKYSAQVLMGTPRDGSRIQRVDGISNVMLSLNESPNDLV
ncbi:hypothetical protein AB7V66_21535, partial [Providencia rettgeri]